MQHAKLVAGTEYLVSRSNKWRDYEYVTIGRVRLLDTQRHRMTRQSWGRSEGLIADDKGDLVQVVYLADDGSDSYEAAVKLTHIRGVWAEADAERQGNLSAAKVAGQARQAKIKAARSDAHELVAQAAVLGLDVATRESGFPDREITFVVTPAKLKAFIERMHAEGYDRGQP